MKWRKEMAKNLSSVMKEMLKEAKGDKGEDLKKAIWYINREIEGYNGE
jgi:hypothetical protein